MVRPMQNGDGLHRTHGFIYIALLMGMAIISIFLSATALVWTQTRQREKEEELLYVGNQIRQAITRFYQQSPTAARRFPTSLDELVDDRRRPDKPMHFLRKLYSDPMTGSIQWGEVRLTGGQLVGVYSPSQAVPLKVAGFGLRDKDLFGKEHYSEWVFRSPLPAANPVLAPGAGYSAPGGGASNPAHPTLPPVPPTFKNGLPHAH